MKKILILFGGTSPERDVSVITGVLTANALDKTRYEAIPVYVGDGGAWFTGSALFDLAFYRNKDVRKLSRVALMAGDNRLYALKKNKHKSIGEIAAAINCSHGAGGEDGLPNGLLTLSHIPVVGGDVLSAAVAMDKVATKYFLKGLSVASLPFFVWTGDFAAAEAFGYPVIVKPARLGSSIGISRVENAAELERAIVLAEKYDDKILVERALTGFVEINCACYAADGIRMVSECEMPVSANAILTFGDKYTDGAEHIFPAPISDALSEKIKGITRTIYDALDFSGIVRVDYLVKSGRVYVNEINAIPGSLGYYLFSDTVAGFTKILNSLVEEARVRFRRQASLLKKFPSPILEVGSTKGGKRLK